MATVSTLEIEIRGRDVDASRLLDNIERRLQQLGRSSNQAGTQLGTSIARGASQATSSSLQLASAQARLLSTTGDNAGAFRVLNTALQQTTTSEIQAIRTKTQLAQIQNRLDGTSRRLTSLFGQLGGQMSQLGGSAGQAAGAFGQLAGSFGTLGTIGAGIGIAKIAVDLAQAGASADLVAQRFDSLAEAAGTSGQALLTAMRAASGGEISDLNLQLAANRAQLLGVADSAQEFSVLMGIARDRAQQMGISTTQAFNDLVTGLGRGSALILDNLGIMVEVTEVNEAYAASLGKTVAQLTEAEKKQALINAVIQQGAAGIAATGGAVDSNAQAWARLSAEVENAKNRLGALLSEALTPVASGLADVAAASDGTTGSIANAAISLQNFQRSLVGLPPLTAEQAAQTRSWGQAILETLGFTNGQTDAIAQNTTATVQQTDATVQAEAAAREQAAALVEQTQKTLEAKLESQQLASFQQALANLAGAVASGHLSAGAAASQMAAQYNIATDAAANLLAMQAALAKAEAHVAEVKVQSFNRANRGGRITQARETAKANQERRDAAEAEERYQRAVGNTSGALSRARRELAATTKGSAAYFDKLTEIQKLEEERQRTAKKATGGGGGGGGGSTPGISDVKLTDQQKLDNQLLAEQDKYFDRVEEAETDHLLKVLEINKDFAEKILEAQRDFQQGNLDSRASFYDNLGSIEDAGLRASMAAQYEQAFAEAQAIAKTKGADVADAFLKAKQQALEAQAQRAGEIQKAIEENDKGKAEYLKGVDQLYRQAEDERLRRIQEGSDSIAAQRDAALREEAARYGQAQDELGNKADGSAQRRIDATLRAGKAVDTERLQVDNLASAYDRLNTKSGGVATSTAPDAPTTSQEAPQGAIGGAGILEALSAIRAAVDNAANMITKAEQDTTRAVRGLASSGGVAG